MSLEQSESEFLQAYNIHDYDIPLVSVDIAIFTLHEGRLKLLLVERNEHPFKGDWSLPGGFIDIANDRDLEESARRKLKEKTGVTTPYLEQVGSEGNAVRDPRGWSVTVLYMALIPHAPTADFVDTVSDARWWPIDKVQHTRLAFDHEKLIAMARDRLKKKTAYTVLPMHVLQPPFSLSQLQSAFELLMDKPLEKKSFRRRILNAGLLEKAGESMPESGRGRPMALYSPRAGSEAYLFTRVFGE